LREWGVGSGEWGRKRHRRRIMRFRQKAVIDISLALVPPYEMLQKFQ
jgi:hypothetical protein